MTLTVEAVYENGVLKPFSLLDLAEHQHGVITMITTTELAENPTPSTEMIQNDGDTAMDEEINRAVAVLRAQTSAKVEQLAKAQLLPKESISLKGLWSHIDLDALDAAFADVRSETNRKLQRLANLQ